MTHSTITRTCEHENCALSSFTAVRQIASKWHAPSAKSSVPFVRSGSPAETRLFYRLRFRTRNEPLTSRTHIQLPDQSQRVWFDYHRVERRDISWRAYLQNVPGPVARRRRRRRCRVAAGGLHAAADGVASCLALVGDSRDDDALLLLLLLWLLLVWLLVLTRRRATAEASAIIMRLHRRAQKLPYRPVYGASGSRAQIT